MLKIVEIIPILSVRRGAESFFSNLCVSLKKRQDVELDVVLLYDEIDKSFVDQFEKNGIKPYYCHKRKGIDIKASRCFERIIQDLNPDIIHTHNCCFFTYFLAFGFKRRNWKYFHTCHSVPEVEATNTEHFFRKIFSKKGLLTNIGISKKVSDAFKEKYGVDNVPYVMNGIPLVYSTETKKQYDFIICASFDENKNHRLLIEAFESLPDCRKYKLICLGTGPLLESIKSLVLQKGLSGNILFTGPVSNVGDYLSASRIFVLPSKNEGIPISILEAMNHGLPIIASNVGGIPDFVSNDNGILFESENKDQLAKAMIELNYNLERYNKISEFNKRYVLDFSIDKSAENYLRIFEGNYEQ